MSYTGKPLVIQGACGTPELLEFGLSCSEDDPCPLHLELSGLEAAGNKLFLAGNLHTSTATVWSILLASDDNGQTWMEPSPRQRGIALDQVQFVDFQTGWVSGHTSSTLPKDPFLLRTADGGRTWRKLPLFTSEEEATFGVVEYFWFDTAQRGTLLADRRAEPRRRYQRLETQNGGESWSLREVLSQPGASRRPRNAASANDDWRLRADAATKSFRVETRREGKWVTLASFAFGAGHCKPSPPPPPPPETPAEKPPQP
jgi:photosystem II stability/assembly factor-like uncharacterized protein